MDVGYFGPDSITWRVHAEPLTMVGGLRALLLQALHPQAMAVMDRVSRFRDEPWTRLQRTVEYVGTVTFGSRPEVDAVTQHVRALHERLGITDVHHLAWVHACEIDSFLTAAGRTGVALTSKEVDRYVTEQAQSARLVGIPEALIPLRADDLDRYFARIRPQLRLTRPALVAARYVIAPPLPVPPRYAVPARLGWTTLSSLAVGLLPGWARRMYRVPAVPGTTFATTASLRGLRLAIGALPDTLRHGPHYRAAQQRLALAG